MTRARSTALRGILVVVALIAAVLVPSFSQPERADAVSAADWDPGNIISDANFYNDSAMSEGEIQQFLETTVGGCQNSNCLASYRADTPTRTSSFGTCSTYVGGTAESAARIIFKVQQACNLSAKVILVTLQKEQSLLTNRAPSDSVMRKAMGYGCPDTASCDSTYYGFFNQIFAAGRQLTWYGNPEGSFTSIKVGQNNAIQYHPNAGCGTKNVLVRNRATAALYYYTPYTPNDAALANLGGTGDGCSAYGNRNFWVFYNNWFGSPTGANVLPFGNIELVAAGPGEFRVAGWAIDPDTAAPISVHVYVGAVGTAALADRQRNDVGGAYPAFGAAHGFDVTVPATGSGDVPVCVYGINTGPGANVLLGCATMAAMSGAPIGALTQATVSPGSIDIAGWAIDPDTTAPISVHLYVDAVGVAVIAAAPRDDLNPAYTQYGRNHGFATSIAAQPGTHQVCAYGINTGPGANTAIECRTVVVPGGAITESGRAPVGSLDSATATTNGVTVSGWAIDPDTAAAIPVHLYVDAAGSAATANTPRNDLPSAWAAYGTGHGFAATLPAAPGTHSVCAYAINTIGPAAMLGCKSVTVGGQSIPDLGRAPFGNVEVIQASPGSIAVSGWAIDPDTAEPIAVHVYVDSTGSAVMADGARVDVGAVYPAYGSERGFSWSGAVTPGAHSVCVYGINNGAGGHSLLRCANVTVPAVDPPSMPPVGSAKAPIGNLDSAVRTDATITVTGWAIDPDTTTPTDVHVYVDAVGTAIRADQSRPDVGAAHGLGDAHGFSASLTVTPGPHRVCAYAIDLRGAPATAVGCIDVS